MARIVKTAEERKLEIIQTSERMFRENGYANTSVNAIIDEIGIAKGTFYHHFNSKEEVLEAIVDHTLDNLIEMAQQVADDASMDAVTKMQVLLSGSHVGDEETSEIADHLHSPGNRELHEATNVQSVLRLAPVLARIVEQGNRENVFDAKRPLETMQFMLTGAQFLLDGGLFEFNEEEIQARRLVTQEILEKALGAESGTFDFMNE